MGDGKTHILNEQETTWPSTTFDSPTDLEGHGLDAPNQLIHASLLDFATPSTLFRCSMIDTVIATSYHSCFVAFTMDK